MDSFLMKKLKPREICGLRKSQGWFVEEQRLELYLFYTNLQVKGDLNLREISGSMRGSFESFCNKDHRSGV